MRNWSSGIFVGAAIIMIALAAGLAAEQDEKAEARPAARSLTLDDYFKIHEVADPQISPDGKWVAYTVTSHDLEKDESETRIWMVPSAGGDPVPMTAKEKSVSRPRWSPDGRYLAFLVLQQLIENIIESRFNLCEIES
mgnify:CR=1 FL=1